MSVFLTPPPSLIAMARSVDPFQALLLIASTTLCIVFLVDGTLLLYLNQLQYTTPTNPSFYVISTAIGLLLRAPVNLLLGQLGSRYGSGRTLSVTFLIIFIGLLSLTFAHVSRSIFLTGYLLYSLISAGRVLRISLISDLVDDDQRTTSMALHQLMTPLANLLGPFIWIIIQKWQGEFVLGKGLVIMNRFAVNYLLCACLVVGMYFVCNRFLVMNDGANREEEPLLMSDVDVEQRWNESTNLIGETENDDSQSTVHLGGNVGTYSTPSLMFYFTVIVLGRATTATYDVAFQTVLVDVFFVSDAELGQIHIIVGMIAIFFPILVAMLSRFVKDRDIIMVGLVLKVIGMALYLPIFGTVQKWQVVIGYILIVKAMIYQTALLSSFTKRTPGDKAAMIGYLYAASNGTAALLRFAVSPFVLRIFGGWGYFLLAIPGLMTISIVVWPTNWHKLDFNVPELKKLNVIK